MPVPQYYGSVSVPPAGAFASATTTTAPFAGAVVTGPNAYGSVSVGDINASRSATGGLVILGGTTERGVLDFGIANAHATTLIGVGASATGNFIASGQIQASRLNFGTTTYVPPVYTNTGTAIGASVHMVVGSISAAGASVTLSLSGAGQFSSNSYTPIVYDLTAGSLVTSFTTLNGTTLSWSSTSGHNYQYTLIGT